MTVYDRESLELLGDLPGDLPAPGDFQGGRPGAGSELALAGEPYEGASRFKNTLANYTPARRTADQEIRVAKPIADARSRDLNRNDAPLQSGTRLRQDTIVGSYFMLNCRPNSKMLFGDEDITWEDEFSEEVEERFFVDAEGEDKFLDAGRRNSLTEMVRLAVEQETVTGEFLSTVEWIRDSDRPFNTAIQMVDTDRLSNPHGRSDPKISMGVELGFHDNPIAYHIRMAHPSDWGTARAWQWKRVPIRKPWGRRQVIHGFTQHRPGQSRGIGTMVAAIPEMKMSRQFRDVVLQNAILNATYAATIESDLSADQIFAKLGGMDAPPEAVQQAYENLVSGQYQALSNFMGGAKNLTIDGVKIPHLPLGSTLKLNGAGQGGPLGTDFEASLNRVIAAALGISYEQFTRDYTKTNYSSGKMAGIETYKAMMAIKRAVADHFATIVFRLWFEEQWNRGNFFSVKRRMPSIYENQNMAFYTACDWIGATRGQVDELKETQASVLRTNNNLATLADENARLGKDWRKVLRQRKREKDWVREYGLEEDETDTTNQTNAASGTKREAGEEGRVPSVGTKENLFFDCEHDTAEETDRKEARDADN